MIITRAIFPIRKNVFSGVSYIGSRLLNTSHIPEDASFEDVNKNIKTKKALLIDVRKPEEFSEGIIPGSVNIEVGKIGPYILLPPKEFKEQTGIDKPKEDDALIITCLRGIRARTAQLALLAVGYKHPRRYAGSYTEWKEKGGEIVYPETKEE